MCICMYVCMYVVMYAYDCIYVCNVVGSGCLLRHLLGCGGEGGGRAVQETREHWKKVKVAYPLFCNSFNNYYCCLFTFLLLCMYLGQVIAVVISSFGERYLSTALFSDLFQEAARQCTIGTSLLYRITIGAVQPI